MDATIVKLKAPGESITLAVRDCKKLEMGRFPGLGFFGVDGDQPVVVEMPEVSADRQLARLGHTRESIVGRTITISRADNPADATKPYWNINLAAGNGNGHTAKATAAAAPEAGGPIAGLDDLPDEPPPIEEAYAAPVPATAAIDKLNALFRLYDLCFDHASGIARRRTSLNPDVAAIAATLYIQANNRGVNV